MSDNTTAFHYSNKMRSKSSSKNQVKCQNQVLKIWEWAIRHKNNLSAVHNPGKLNTIADKESQSLRIDTETMLQSF